ncbi:centrosomal and chromosomal factor [Onthophagus taurus]|uniref:centrosomal and chromosomal factor n=1 Tax=Onthophagus taurus TaxID=166361 RepID=UPI000C204696|nr:centrosomal and chromosomal factor [Onthophagus taurus]
MASCYPSYDPSAVQQQQQQQQTVSAVVQRSVVQQKDYSRPLHVDCSVEYELPNQAKPPVGVRNEPLLMIHPCYFRKIESQRRSPFVNNLPNRQQTSSTSAATISSKRRMMRGQQLPQQVPQQAAQYPVQYAERQQQQLWDSLPPLVPINTTTSYCSKRDNLVSGTTTYSSGSDSGHWTDPDRSPDRPDDKHILTGKYRQYLRAHRLHPYVSSAIPIASTFPQIHQVCYNV